MEPSHKSLKPNGLLGSGPPLPVLYPYTDRVPGLRAETGGAITLCLFSPLGIPISTTHAITGAIVGIGASRRGSAVRFGVTLYFLGSG